METVRNAKFDSSHRCDACGARAMVRYRLKSGGELLFCAHHAFVNADALSDKAVILDDARPKLWGSDVTARA